MTKLLTTSEAAKLAGVAPSSIKRWAEQNVLPCVRTAGGHRRFELKTLQEFLDKQGPANTSLTDHDEFIELMIAGKEKSVVSKLYALLEDLNAWCHVADAMEPVLAKLGTLWASGEISVGQEHMASETLSRSIIHVTSALPAAGQPRRCLLAVAEGDDHELGLRLADLCVRARQWKPVWLGRYTSTEILIEHLGSEKCDMVALSASRYSIDADTLNGITKRLEEACRTRGAQLVLGGSGSWPMDLNYAKRIRSFSEFDGILGAKEKMGISSSI